ncbi:MAG: DEAD/DEAH box helicase [Anaerolineales bacterium]
MNFESFNLHPRVYAGVKDQGYTTPTPIQLQAIPPISQGRDVMGLAQTGTGKTAAFVLPILQHLLNHPTPDARNRQVRALIVAPTRELAEQIHETIRTLGKHTQTRSMTIYGGVGLTPQIDKLRAGVDIVVACPGRLLDHINQGNIRLNHLQVLVLDEADMMFDMGFLPDVRRILKHLPAKRQTLLFSATMPEEVRHLAHDVLTNPVTVQVDRIAPAETVSHALYPVSQHLKTPLLMELLKKIDSGSVLVFTRTKHRAKRVAEQLNKAGFFAASLQGNLSQTRRQAALDGFRKGNYHILVATDIAARGIDVASISHVINYDIPDTVDAYTHRIGRTGRAAKTGDAFTLVTPDDTPMIRSIEKILGQPIERRKMPGFDYSVAAPQRDQEFARLPREARPPLPPRGPRKPQSPPRGDQPPAPRTAPPAAVPQRAENHRPPASHPAPSRNSNSGPWRGDRRSSNNTPKNRG